MGHPTDPCGPCSDDSPLSLLQKYRASSGGCTLCDRQRKNNVWVDGPVDSNNQGGICLLDTMTEDQVIGVLQVDEKARADLRLVTSNPDVLALADSVDRLPTTNEGDELQSDINRNKDSIPFYSVFRGQPPFCQ